MKIAQVDSYFLSIPATNFGRKPPAVAGIPWTTFDLFLVRIRTEDGIEGWGEGFVRAKDYSIKRAFDLNIAPKLLGRDARSLSGIKFFLEKTLHNIGRVGVLAYGISAVDIALWDIAAKRAQVPLSDLLGGRHADEIEVYASLLRYAQADEVERIVDKVLGEGYRRIKLHEIDAGVCLAARKAAGEDVPIYLDVNCPWTPSEAVRFAQQVQPGSFAWIEEPVWPPEDYLGIADVRKRGGIKVAAGENFGSVFDFRNAFVAGAVDYAQPSFAKSLGISEALKIAALAESHGVDVVPHNAVIGLALLATLYFNAAQRSTPPLELLYFGLDAHPIGDWLIPRSGRLAVPAGPGLGFDPDPGVIRRYLVE